MKRWRRWMHGHERAVTAVAVVAAAAVALVVGSMSDERQRKQAAIGSSVTTEPSLPAVSEPSAAEFDPPVTAQRLRGRDYVLDLNTGTWRPLPKAILRSRGDQINSPRYTASPNGSRLAFVGRGDEGRPQIFVAGIDGSGVRQVTHDPTGVQSPAWSPDGASIAYSGYGSGDVANLFVVDVATGESMQITHATHNLWPGWGQSQFTPDGSSLLYTGGSDIAPVLRTVPIAGGRSTLLIGPGDGLNDAGNGALSPDGSLVTFLASGTPLSGEVEHCGPCRWLANADGTNKRVILACFESNPAGTWSPDGSRIVCLRRSVDDGRNHIVVVDIVTGHASDVAVGSTAIWLDRDTLLIEA